MQIVIASCSKCGVFTKVYDRGQTFMRGQTAAQVATKTFEQHTARCKAGGELVLEAINV